MYELEIKPEADKIFRKLESKDKAQLLKIDNKIQDLLNNPLHEQKFLKGELKGFNRVHIGHFVLIYKIDDKRKTIIVYYYAHHDKVYLWRE